MPTNPPGYLREYFEREKMRIIVALGGHCAICGTTEELEIHHRNKWKGRRGTNGRGSLARLTDWKRELARGGLLLLCDPCHDQNHIEERLAQKAAQEAIT